MFMFDNLIVKKDQVFHVGDLDETKRSGYSHEGNSLSVSTHPLAWIKINRINSNQVIVLNNISFINVFKVKENKTLMNDIKNYALKHNMITPCDLYFYEFIDDNDEECEFITDCYEDMLGEGVDFKTRKGFKTTEQLCQFFELKSISPVLLDDFLIIFYFLDKTKIKAFWWDEVLDVYSYSAPRGAIFNFCKKSSNFQIKNINDI